ncbi:MAG TPA: hypothetical protein VI981_01040 [Candidatus Paceibacterota bacterium]
MKFSFLQRIKKTGSPTSLGINVHRDWVVLFLTTVVLALCVLTFSYNFFRKIERGDAFLVNEEQPVGLENLDRKKLGDTVNFYERHREQFSNLEKNRPPYKDPSL